MGRRKIEIQPITHERNRSVTFLKRKNGLFKKAYELGVLCSVEVAVIIFEERPGHHLKLYQYCSSDVSDVVQRHLRYDGEKDTRGPQDFSGNAPNKLEDIGEGEDDDGDDDDDTYGARPKRRSDGKLKPANNNISVTNDYDYPSRMTIPQPPLSVDMTSGSNNPGYPLSSHERQLRSNSGSTSTSSPNPTGGGALQPASKKPRLIPNITNHHSRSSSDDPVINVVGASQPSANPYPAYGSAGPSYRHPQQHSHQQQPGGYPGVFQNYGTPPPSSYMPDLFPSTSPRPGGPGSRGSTTSNGIGPYGGGGGRGGYDQGMYQLMRGPQTGGGGGGDLFAMFDERGGPPGHHPSAHPGPGYGGSLDWPVHQSGAGPAPSAGPPPQTSGGDHWLDLISGGVNISQPAQPSNGTSRDASMSWERSAPVSSVGNGVDLDMFNNTGPPTRTSSHGSPLPKRGRLISPSGTGSANGSTTGGGGSPASGFGGVGKEMAAAAVGEVGG